MQAALHGQGFKLVPAIERYSPALLPASQFHFLREEKLVPARVAILINLLRHQLDAANPADKGRKARRPVCGTVELDVPDVFDADASVLDQLGQGVHVAKPIHQHIGTLAGGEDVARMCDGRGSGSCGRGC